jgi:hypothetical protein
MDIVYTYIHDSEFEVHVKLYHTGDEKDEANDLLYFQRLVPSVNDLRWLGPSRVSMVVTVIVDLACS